MAKAGDETALLEQVKQLASQGQDAATAAQVNEYVDANKDAISAVLKGYVTYINQLQAMTADTGVSTAPQAAAATATAPVQTAGAAVTTGATSTALRTSSVQPSGGLRTAHLAGYPALPDVDPVSSITEPTAAQLEYAAKVQQEMQARKQYLMAHPEGYTY